MREDRHFAFLCTHTFSPGLYAIALSYISILSHFMDQICRVPFPRKNLCNFTVYSTLLRRRASRSHLKDVPR